MLFTKLKRDKNVLKGSTGPNQNHRLRNGQQPKNEDVEELVLTVGQHSPTSPVLGVYQGAERFSAKILKGNRQH